MSLQCRSPHVCTTLYYVQTPAKQRPDGMRQFVRSMRITPVEYGTVRREGGSGTGAIWG
jgi:hypothetical protein